jgi:hypothetical protein
VRAAFAAARFGVTTFWIRHCPCSGQSAP